MSVDVGMYVFVFVFVCLCLYEPVCMLELFPRTQETLTAVLTGSDTTK